MTLVADAFRDLVATIQPTSDELARARMRLAAIRTRLDDDYGVARADIVGSHAKGTAVTSYSDFDYFVVLRAAEARWGERAKLPVTFLNNIRDSLRDRYPQTDVRGSTQAVELRFADGCVIDVVPAVWDRFSGRPIFRIPDGDAGWRQTSPALQSKYLGDANSESRQRLVRLIQLLKWWALSRDATSSLKSLYVEMALAAARIEQPFQSHRAALAAALAHLARTQCRAIEDPLGISGTLYATTTELQRRTLAEYCADSSTRAAEAVALENAGRGERALALWSRVFNGRVPF